MAGACEEVAIGKKISERRDKDTGLGHDFVSQLASIERKLDLLTLRMGIGTGGFKPAAAGPPGAQFFRSPRRKRTTETSASMDAVPAASEPPPLPGAPLSDRVRGTVSEACAGEQRRSAPTAVLEGAKGEEAWQLPSTKAPPVETKPTLRRSVQEATPLGSAAEEERRRDYRAQVRWNSFNNSQSFRPNFERLATSVGLGNLSSRIQDVLEVAEQRRSWQIVHGPTFQTCYSIAIALNSLFIGYHAGEQLNVEAYNQGPQAWVNIIELMFCFFFLAELGLRMLVERVLFFLGPDWKWNLFDSILVLMSLVDLFMSGSTAMASLTVGRILRLARFFRLMRITRVIRRLHRLRLVVFAIIDSMSSLFWCFLIVFFIIYVFAVLFVYATAEYFRDANEYRAPEISAASAAELKHWYGGIYQAMVTLFMAIAGGADWVGVMEPLLQMGSLYGPIFIFYIFFMYFGVLNVVVGAFVATTSEIASKDREFLVTAEMGRLDSYTRRIKSFFREADSDKSGTLSWEEFTAHLENHKVKAYFQALELDVAQAHVLFDLLDVDGSNQVTVDEFLDGCIRLKGQARSVDLNMLLYMCKKVFDQMTFFMGRTEQNLELLERRLGIEFGPVPVPGSQRDYLTADVPNISDF